MYKYNSKTSLKNAEVILYQDGVFENFPNLFNLIKLNKNYGADN